MKQKGRIMNQPTATEVRARQIEFCERPDVIEAVESFVDWHTDLLNRIFTEFLRLTETR